MTPEDFQNVSKLLGRPATGARSVARRDSRGRPQVVEVATFQDLRPFPTLFWLVDPVLNQKIDRLEASGLVKELEKRIESNEELCENLKQDNLRYINRRWKAMNPEERQRIQEKGLKEIFLAKGIGGIGSWNKVRCLHMHYAHFLIEDNCIGRILHKEFGIPLEG